MKGIAEAAKSLAWVGAIASMPNSIGRTARQMIRDFARIEKISYTFQRLGVPDEDVQCHNAVVKSLAQTSPVFSNRAVEFAGMNLALRRVARADPVIPEDPRQWAKELWDEIVFANRLDIERTISHLYGCGVSFTDYILTCNPLEVWQAEAERLWKDGSSLS